MYLSNILLVFVGILALAQSYEDEEPEVQNQCMSVMRELIETGRTPEKSSSKVRELEEDIKGIRDEFTSMIRNIEGACYVGATSGKNPAFKVTASSDHADCLLKQIYIHSPRAWCADTHKEIDSWVQLDLGTARKITGVVTRGRGNYPQWVTKYTVAYGNVDSSLEPVLEDGVVKEFEANVNQQTPVRNFFPEPVEARYFRIYPKTKQGHTSMRMDLLDC